MVENYFAGNLDALKGVMSAQTGSAFFESSWNVMKRIPVGQTMSYQQLAAASGSPLAIRAAGTSCAQNKLILLVPCHRIVKTDGGLGNYLYGADIKQFLLEHEARYA